jgi:hypothetical protein
MSHNINYAHSWLQDLVAPQQKVLDKIVELSASDFGGSHSTFCFMITGAVRSYGFLLRPILRDVCRPYLVTADSVVRYAFFRIFWVSPEVQTHYQINCATRQLSSPAELGGLNVPSFALDAKLAHYAASFDATLVKLMSEYEALAGGAAVAAPERGALESPSAPTSTSTRWALVTL